MGNNLTDAENAALVMWTSGGHSHSDFMSAVREAIRVTERRYEQSVDAQVALSKAVARQLATALDSVVARIYRDINPDSSYQPVDDERLVKVLSDFTAYAEEQLAVLDNPDVIQVLADAEKGN